jgi:putative oxidoreductase
VSRVSGVLEGFLPYTPYLALLLRVWVGANFMAHGYPKLTKGRQQTVQAMKSMGVPASVTTVTAILEFFGGIFLIVGLIVPIVGLFFATEMVATTILKKYKMKAAYIGAGQKASYEVDITYLLLSIALIVLGAGALSIDGAVGL